MRSWIVAIGAGALISGIVLYVITVFAVPIAYESGFFGDEPQACINGTAQQCADAHARLVVMRQIQPLAWFIAGFGVILLVLGLIMKPVAPVSQPETEHP